MILWQKQATTSWLAANETSLEILAGSDLAIIARPGKPRTLVQVTCRDRVAARKLRETFGGTVRPCPRFWARPQKPHAPFRIGRRLEIVSERSGPPRENDTRQLVIPAAGAFGTGEHATTAMSLRLLEASSRKLAPGWRLLDAGTGTGILALAARRFGAGRVLGLDNDPRAIAHARSNARLNRISRASFTAADVLNWKPAHRYDFITANLFSELLIAALPSLLRALHKSGGLIASGILRDQANSVTRALRRHGFQLQQQRRRGKWVALQAARG
ncbi:MAG: 50S ribosomal protein L11 methyltransferase [Spartobacteria bacterium]